MRVAFITPVSLLYTTSECDYHLVLPQPLRRYSGYYTFYKSAYGYKILDNGEAEGLPTDPAVLFAMAQMIQANEIVIPDVIGNSELTMKRLREFAPLAEAHPEFKYMGVLQGDDRLSVRRCMDALIECPYVHTIGVPKHLSKLTNRVTLVRALEADSDKEIHMLGCAPHALHEVRTLAETTRARGIDTSLPTFAALWGFDIKRDNVDGAYRPDDYWDMTAVTKEEKTLVRRNHKTFRKWARAT